MKTRLLFDAQKGALNEMGTFKSRLVDAMKAGEFGAIDWNITGNTFWYNDIQKRLFGIPKEVVPDSVNKWFMSLAPQDRVRITKGLQNIFKKKLSKINSVFRIIQPNHDIRWIKVKARVIYRAKKPYRLIGVTYDVTQRQQIERALAYKEKASLILSSSLDYHKTLRQISKLAVPGFADWCSVDILDNHGKLRLMAIAHQNKDKVKWAKKLRRDYPPNLNTSTGFGKILKTGKSQFYPVISDKMLIDAAKNAKELYLMRYIGFSSAISVPITVKRKTIGVISFVSTESKTHYTRNDLKLAEQIGSRASLAIENAMLYERHQHDQMEEIKRRDDFISLVSHELKTPVTTMRIYSQLLYKYLQALNDKKGLLYVINSDKQLVKMTKLIEELLDFSRIHSKRLRINKKRFSLDTLIRETVSEINPLTSHDITYTSNKKISVLADRYRLSQVITNLLINAIKYSPENRKVKVYTHVNNKSVIVSVKDFGIGIPRNKIKKLFERYYRIGDDRYKNFPGLGLGLFISKEIVKRHRGKMMVESREGHGSTFSFRLPIS